MAEKEDSVAPESGATETQEKADSITSGKVKVNFGVHIPELGKTYTKDELECDEVAIDYLIEIDSKAITILKK